MSFEATLKASATRIEAFLGSMLTRHQLLPGDNGLGEAMRYAVLNGGKRLRAFLVMESARLHGIAEANALGPAAAIEAIHAYSLVHDDLPCMDDDDLRQGLPTVHKKWDEATAVLVGDALQSFAFEMVTISKLPAERRLELSTSLAVAAGHMVKGQALDIAAETAGTAPTFGDIATLQRFKTGALIEWSALAGPRMAGLEHEALNPLTRYAECLGLAFQIADDILDETGDEAKAGKRLHKDADAGKATFVSLLGLDGAKARARALVAEAVDALALYDARADNLREAARFVISRDS